jgi:hypothetical protein
LFIGAERFRTQRDEAIADGKRLRNAMAEIAADNLIAGLEGSRYAPG